MKVSSRGYNNDYTELKNEIAMDHFRCLIYIGETGKKWGYIIYLNKVAVTQLR